MLNINLLKHSLDLIARPNINLVDGNAKLLCGILGVYICDNVV